MRIDHSPARIGNGGGSVVVNADGSITETPATGKAVVGPGGASEVWPEWWGAKADYNPATGVGTDSTAAFASALGSLQPHQRLRLHDGVYLITAQLNTPATATIVGAGKGSVLWGQLAGGTGTLLYLGPGGNTQATARLKDFAIQGGVTPGTNAIAADALVNGDIDVAMGGGWQYLFYVHRTASGIAGPELGYVQNSRVRLFCRGADVHYGWSGAIGVPVNGVYVRGWANVVDWDLDLNNITGTGIDLEGTYASANSCTISGSFQGVTGPAVVVNGGYNTALRDIYTESVGSPAVQLTGVAGGRVEGYCLGAVSLTTCSDCNLLAVQGQVTVSADSVRTKVRGGNADAVPLVNGAISTVAEGYRAWNTVTGTRFPTAGSDLAQSNVVLNGDFRRVLAGATHEQAWGWGGFYLATQCGAGLADTTATDFSPYCVQVQQRVSFGSQMKYALFAPGNLAGLVGLDIWVSFKVKVTAGTVYFQLADTSAGAAFQEPVASYGVAVENGFSLIQFAWQVTAAMVTNGASFSIHVPTVNSIAAVAYVSEVMAGLGNAAPPQYLRPARHYKLDSVGMFDGALRYHAAAAPVGGDPVVGSAWQVGDIVENSTPVASGTIGWVCTTAGSPGTWKTYGTIQA